MVEKCWNDIYDSVIEIGINIVRIDDFTENFNSRKADILILVD
jgi:hypothetical protein